MLFQDNLLNYEVNICNLPHAWSPSQNQMIYHQRVWLRQDIDSGEISSISAGGFSYYNVYGVTWPKGEKEAEEQCVDTFGARVSTDEMGKQRSTFHSCRCEKRWVSPSHLFQLQISRFDSYIFQIIFCKLHYAFIPN